MTLKEYLEKNKISIENAAKDLGFSYEDMFPVIYADTRHLNAVICLKKAGFEWVDRKKKLLRRLQK